MKTSGDRDNKNNPGLRYYAADKLSWRDYAATIPRELIPTKRTNYIFGALWLIVVIIGIINIFANVFSGSMFSFSGAKSPGEPALNLEIEIGLPWPFLRFDFNEVDKFPILIKGLFFDLILYFLVAYALDVLISVFSGVFLNKSKKQKMVRARLYRVEENLK